MRNKFKKAQEEMVGFALIIIIVAVILLVFLGFSLRSSTKDIVESYEVESFIQSFLQYTTDCRDKTNDILTIRELILECNDFEECSDGKKSCEILNSTLNGILMESWKIGVDRPIKGYKLNITSQDQPILLLEEGNITINSKGNSYPLGKRDIWITIKIYY